jgi:hypothetical protein
MLLNEFSQYLEETMILFDKLEYLEEIAETDMRLNALYKEFKRILLLEAVTDSIKMLQDFLDVHGSEIELLCDKQLGKISARSN